MKTVKLYDQNAYIKDFSATVLLCEKCENGYKIQLDKTAFFPEEGGQPSDTGSINGVKVTYVIEENGIIYHYTEKPFQKDEKIEGHIDFNRRFVFMQNHSGEHIVSGVVYKNFGFNNVGFHLNEQFATVDFDGILSREMLDYVENAANDFVYKNLPVKAYYPTAEELKRINYRSKKEIDGDIRIVDIKGADICACCAPHVNSTGEIGIIKILDASKMRGGTRVVLKCGSLALLDYRDKFLNISEISAMLSAKQNESAKAVNSLISQNEALNQKVNELTRKITEIRVLLAKDEPFCFVEDNNMKEMQLLADGLHKSSGKTHAVFSGKDTYNFVICGDEAETEKIFSEFKDIFSVRGGGRNGMVQGSVNADIEKIKSFFYERLK
ncbi:MAG: alanyl-tRNA editing protein [Clostridia bacterium]|nr:alanyl-tRNA editing protein [Clostridia bacterium]